MRSLVAPILTFCIQPVALAVGLLTLSTGGCSCSLDRRQPEASAEEESESTSSSASANNAEKKEKENPQQEAETPLDKTAGETADTSSEPDQSAAKGQVKPSQASSKQPRGKSASSAEGAGLTAAGSSAVGAAKESSPEKAAQRAGVLSSKAKGLENKGELAQAYSTTLEAWELVRTHPNDGRCESLTAELARDLERLGEEINARSTGGSNGLLVPDVDIR